MMGEHAWSLQNLNLIPVILKRIPSSFWERNKTQVQCAGLTGTPEFKGLPFEAEAYIRYDGVLNQQEMGSFCAAGYFLWRYGVKDDSAEPEAYVLMVVEQRFGAEKLGFPGGKRDSAAETPCAVAARELNEETSFLLSETTQNELLHPAVHIH